jgi:hypothetical protein
MSWVKECPFHPTEDQHILCWYYSFNSNEISLVEITFKCWRLSVKNAGLWWDEEVFTPTLPEKEKKEKQRRKSK